MSKADDAAKLTGALVRGILGERSQQVARTSVGGFVVSTVLSTDRGYETAILDSQGAWPVERYETLEQAEKGHEEWCGKIADLRTVSVLGYGELVRGWEQKLVPLHG